MAAVRYCGKVAAGDGRRIYRRRFFEDYEGVDGGSVGPGGGRYDIALLLLDTAAFRLGTQQRRRLKVLASSGGCRHRMRQGNRR